MGQEERKVRVRVSYGTAVRLGLMRGRLNAEPTTAYLMTHYAGRCRNDCAFCPQARNSRASLEKLSRVTWPVFEMDGVVEHLKKSRMLRICIQTVDYPGMVGDVMKILRALKDVRIPISISITPVESETLRRFKDMGVDYIGIGLDVASERIYGKIKRSAYSWSEMWDFLRRSIEVFGRRKAVVHIIVGLGETDRELYDTIRRVYLEGGEVSLFAFTPVKGTELEKRSPPDINRYRKIQALHYLIRKGLLSKEPEFRNDGSMKTSFEELVDMGVRREAFLTHGCPGCNRPYYNERPGSEPYNYPSLSLVPEGILKPR